MDEQTILTITIRKPVADVPAAMDIFHLVQNRLSDWPDVSITGQVTTKFIEEAEAPE